MNDLLGIAASLLAVVGTVPYVRNMVRGKTQPHAFTWLIWGTLTSIGCAAQLAGGGGPGAWSTGVSALCCFTITCYAIVKGNYDIVLVDWLSLAGAVLAGLAWPFTHDPLWSTVLVSVIDALAYIPTFRKTFNKPWSETLSAYLWPYPKHVLALLALDTFSVTTSLYPLMILAANAIFITYTCARRRQLSESVT